MNEKKCNHRGAHHKYRHRKQAHANDFNQFICIEIDAIQWQKAKDVKHMLWIFQQFHFVNEFTFIQLFWWFEPNLAATDFELEITIEFAGIYRKSFELKRRRTVLRWKLLLTCHFVKWDPSLQRKIDNDETVTQNGPINYSFAPVWTLEIGFGDSNRRLTNISNTYMCRCAKDVTSNNII